MDLARFTQIRSVQSGNSFELAKLHFRLEIPKDRAYFLAKLGEVSFAQLCDLALRYLQSEKVVQRANLAMERLSSGNHLDRLGEDIGLELPPVDVMQYVYRIAYNFPDLVNDKGMVLKKFQGSEVDTLKSLKAVFPPELTYDLIALYLNPGVFAEYRTWLSMLFKLCSILESGSTIAHIVSGVREVKGVSGLHLAQQGTRAFVARRFFHGRVLMPGVFKADLPPVMAPTMSEDADSLHSTNRTGQLHDQLDGSVNAPRDYALAPVPHMEVGLTTPGEEYSSLGEGISASDAAMEQSAIEQSAIASQRGEIK